MTCVTMGRTVSPGVRMSTSSCDSPRCRSAAVPEVRTSAIMYWARCAPLVQTLRPLMAQPRSVRTALVRIDARSLPESGSDMPMQK